MRLDFLPLDRLFVDKANMRHGRKAPDVSDLLPTVRKRGVLQPLIVRPDPDGTRFGIVAGSRRFHAACLVAGERRPANDDAPGPDGDPGCLLPCAILDEGDDAGAVEASLIENVARLDPDEVTLWVTFTRLVKEGRDVDDIAATFGMPELGVRRILALGNLLPRIRSLYANEDIDRATVRHLTMASRRQQQEWLALVDDPDKRAPTGSALKAWLTGGQSLPVRVALFDVEASGLATIADLFGEDRFFADPDAFWTAQNEAVAARAEGQRGEGWSVVILPPGEFFHSWEYDKTPKRKGGRVYIDVRGDGEVLFHTGYRGRRERAQAERGQGSEGATKAVRPELTSTLAAYVDLHRHAAARAAMTGHPGVALRLMVAHAVAGGPLWSVRTDPQASRDEATLASLAASPAEARFGECRQAVCGLLGLPPDEPVVTGAGVGASGVAGLFLRLLDLPDAAVLDVAAVVMGETLAVGSAAVEALGLTLKLDMADWWQPDAALFDLIRDKEVLGAIVAEVAGERVAAANAGETGKTLKMIVANHLAGDDGREKVERWVPRWMAFPPGAYTARGGVATVTAHAQVAAAGAISEQARPVENDEEDAPAPAGAAAARVA